ncbi:MAG: multiubiquitin domain-containing protein [Dehalococcoidia bacterium]
MDTEKRKNNEHGEHETPEHHMVAIVVNEHAVNVQGPRITGLEIKEASIAQGVSIQLSFVLYEETGINHTKTIGDSEIVTVHPKSRFVAIANDDNS